MIGPTSRHKHKPASKPQKVLLTPGWASEGTLIGYTFGVPLTIEMLEDMQGRARADLKSGAWRSKSKPSVYYEGGHATLQHGNLDNVGWTKSEQWKWLYFGNVPQASAHQKGHGDNNSGDQRNPRIQFAERMRKDYGSYCWGDGSRTEWNLKGNRTKGWTPNDTRFVKGDHLLEIWVKQSVSDALGKGTQISKGVLDAHGSRNRFRWVDDKALKATLHALATEWIDMLEQLRQGAIRGDD